MNNLKEAKKELNGNRIYSLKNNVVLVDCGNSVELTHYNQTIALWDKNGFKLIAPNYTVNGKLSRTTVKILNENCPNGMKITSNKKGTFLESNNNYFGEIIQELKL